MPFKRTKCYFDMSIGNKKAGRIVFEVLTPSPDTVGAAALVQPAEAQLRP